MFTISVSYTSSASVVDDRQHQMCRRNTRGLQLDGQPRGLHSAILMRERVDKRELILNTTTALFTLNILVQAGPSSPRNLTGSDYIPFPHVANGKDRVRERQTGQPTT